MSATLLHISDLHFGTVVDEALAGVLEVVDKVNPDVVIVSGDVTQRGRASELAGFLALLKQLAPRTVLSVPGNHDVSWWPPWNRVLAPLKGFESVVPAEHRRPFALVNDVVVLAVGSVDPWRQVAGTLSASALATLGTIAKATPAAVRVAFTHHPIALDRPTHRRTNVALNAQEAADALANANVDLLLSGHIHIPFATTTTTAFPGLSRSFVLAGAGTATSSRTRATQARALQVVRVERARLEIERHEMPQDKPDFVVVGTSMFVKANGSWRAA
ncbi:MAG: metallophosphoesterase [Deltaproteobacteria bacterium]|nr:metallophosphoesterase [Deltaproteobacteria bacterium]